MQQEYNDNLFMSVDDRRSSLITTLSGGVEVTERTDRLDTGLTLKLDQVLFTDEDRVGTALNQLYRGRGSYRLTERLSLEGGAAFERNSRPDREIEKTGLVIEPVRRDRQEYSVGGSYILTETTSAVLSYAHLREDFDDAVGSKNRVHAVNFGLQRDLGRHIPSATGRVNLGYSTYSFRDQTESTTDKYTVTAGITWAANELWKVFADAGGNFTVSDSEFTVGPALVRTSTSAWEATAKAGVDYKDEYNSGTLTFSHDVVPASGRSGASQRTGATIDLRHRFTYELSGFFSAGYFMNRSERGEFSAVEIDETTVNLNLGARYEITKDFSLEGRYGYTRVLFGVRDQAAERNAAVFSLVYRYPLME
jgi:long-subunit fatty acid transport protein